MMNFDFLEKDLGLVSPLYFVYDFSRKMFFMLYSMATSKTWTRTLDPDPEKTGP